MRTQLFSGKLSASEWISRTLETLLISIGVFVGLEVLYYLMASPVFNNVVLTILIIAIPVGLIILALVVEDDFFNIPILISSILAFIFVRKLWKNSWGSSIAIGWFSSHETMWLIINICLSLAGGGIIAYFIKKERDFREWSYKQKQEEARKREEEAMKKRKQEAEEQKRKAEEAARQEKQRVEEEQAFYMQAQTLGVSFICNRAYKGIKIFMNLTDPENGESRKFLILETSSNDFEELILFCGREKILKALNKAKYYGFKVSSNEVGNWLSDLKDGSFGEFDFIYKEEKNNKTNYKRSEHTQNEQFDEEIINRLFILGFKITDKPSKEELISRHKELVKQYHSDRWPDEKKDYADKKLQAINEAFDFLMAEFKYK